MDTCVTNVVLETCLSTALRPHYSVHPEMPTEEDAAFANVAHLANSGEPYRYGNNFLSHLGLGYGNRFKNFTRITTPDISSEFFDKFHCILLSQETLFGPKYTLSHTYSVQKVHTKP